MGRLGGMRWCNLARAGALAGALVMFAGCSQATGGPGPAGAGAGPGAPPAVSSTATTATSTPAGAVTTLPTPAPASAGPGHCHARGSGEYELPDPVCTPGVTNPAVTQSDIGQTICTPGWTATVRPPESYTEPLKYQQMAAYGESGPAGDYEEDHLIPLELGGSPSDPRNLWPEPGASPNPKDAVEYAANRAVCAGRMPLAAAQQAIASDWVTLGRQLGAIPPATAAPPAGAPAASGAGTCSVTAAFNSQYGDWDVYVRSDQPDQTVTVTAGGGLRATWRTDASGYADVYLHAPASAAGQPITVTVGSAVCSGAL